MQMSVCEKCQENLVEGKERKTNLALVENAGLAICKLTDFEGQVLVDHLVLFPLDHFSGKKQQDNKVYFSASFKH